jgi:hypothetical protein
MRFNLSLPVTDTRNALGFTLFPEGVVFLTFGDPAVLAFQL